VKDPDNPGRYHVIDRGFPPTFQREFALKAFPAVLSMCMNLDGEVFFWPCETESDTAS
jgi:hypothetical protein